MEKFYHDGARNEKGSKLITDYACLFNTNLGLRHCQKYKNMLLQILH